MSDRKRGAFEGTVDSVFGAVGILWDLLSSSPAEAPKSAPDVAKPRQTIPPVVVVGDETIDTEGEEV